MSLDPKKTAKIARKLPEEGLQEARCFAIIDLGIQQGSYKGQPTEPQPEVMLCWELTKFMNTYKEEDGPVPATIMQKYTFSNGKKAKLPKVLKSWGQVKKELEVLNLKPYLGQYCMLNIEHTANGDYANISGNGTGVNPFMAQLKKPKPFYDNIWFDLDQFSWELFNKLPQYPQKLIQKSENWPAILKQHPAPVGQGVTAEQEEVQVLDDDTPNF